MVLLSKSSQNVIKSPSAIKEFTKNIELTFLALPALVFVFIFNYIPLYGLILPFKNFTYDKGFLGSPWVGFSNFRFLFNSDSLWTITRNTVCMNFLFIVIGNVCSIAIALMLFEVGKRFIKLYETLMFLPYFISWVVATYVFFAFLDMDHGFINKMLALVGKDPVMWYNEPGYWPLILVTAAVWKGIGYGAVVYYTGLMGIDPEYYEAATIDGAKRLQQAFYISIPLIKQLIIMIVILQIGKIFYGDFGLFYNVTLDSSQLYPATDVIDTYVYRSLRTLGDFGMSSAAGLYQTLVGFILVLLSNMVVRKIDRESAMF